jgi:hypothetical protein
VLLDYSGATGLVDCKLALKTAKERGTQARYDEWKPAHVAGNAAWNETARKSGSGWMPVGCQLDWKGCRSGSRTVRR